jgi:hypothetical protein
MALKDFIKAKITLIKTINLTSVMKSNYKSLKCPKADVILVHEKCTNRRINRSFECFNCRR